MVAKIVRMSTTDRDVAERWLKETYGDSLRAAIDAPSRDFQMRATVATLGALRLVQANAANVSCSKETDGFLQIVVPLQGALLHHPGGDSNGVIADVNTGVIVRPFDRSIQVMRKGMTLTLSVPSDLIVARAEILTCRELKKDLAYEAVHSLSLSTPISASLVRNMRAAFSELQTLALLGAGELASSGYEDILLNLAVPVLFPQIIEHILKDAVDCKSSLVVTARDYIVAHATETIELSNLAANLNISMRALQYNFQKAYGFSPRDFILECRLERARALLLSAAPDSTVTAIALASGFSDLSHFSAKYKDKFGELPSQTLRTAKAWPSTEIAGL